MNFFDNEEEIIDWFQTTVDHSEVLFPLCTDDAIRVFEAVHNQEKWTKWKNSSGKDVPPPDFYSDEYGLMMEVMRVDDHSRASSANKFINPTTQRESELQKELKESGLLGGYQTLQKYLLTPLLICPQMRIITINFIILDSSALLKNTLKAFLYIEKIIPSILLYFLFLMNLRHMCK